MISWYRLMFILGMFAGYQIIYLESTAKSCTHEQTLKKFILQKWIPDVLLDKYPDSNTKGVKSSQLPCTSDFTQDFKKYITEGIFSLFKPHWVYFVTPKVYNAISIQIPVYQANQKIKPENQYKQRTTPKPLKKTYCRPKISKDTSNTSLKDAFTTSLNKFENLFYQTNFDKLTKISPADRKVNGISFVQSGLFMYLILTALSMEVDSATKKELKNVLSIEEETMGNIKILENVISQLPTSNKMFKFRWGSRLLVKMGLPISRDFEEDVAETLNLKIMRIMGTETPEHLSSTLNSMIENDSGGTLRHTFDEDDFNGDVCAILVSTVNIRARWRKAPTVLNGTRRFYDAKDVKQERSVRMIRINDIMRYVNLDEWNAEAIEINYATPGLTLLMLMPYTSSLRGLTAKMMTTSPQEISDKMSTMRISAILPLYTLRMTLLLPEKLQSMGITRLFNNDKNGTCDRLTLTHAVQRLMFWSEAGRHAYKDDGLQWDETPDREIIVNRPYLFYVRWKNMTIMNGNFAL